MHWRSGRRRHMGCCGSSPAYCSWSTGLKSSCRSLPEYAGIGWALDNPVAFAGIIELIAGALITIGLFTRPAAFVASGTMAVAYWMMHAPQNFWPVNNGGDAAILFCFVFLYFVFAGPGAFSVDGRSTYLEVTDAERR